MATGQDEGIVLKAWAGTCCCLAKNWQPFEGPIRRPEGGSEWEPIKILLKNLACAPKSLPKNIAHTCQDHVVTTDLLTLGTSYIKPKNKAEASTK
jgi:hypothetical protein